jgi:hypothetical protein
MLKIKIKLFLFFYTCLLACKVDICAQIVVKDTSFAKSICIQYPNIMNLNCQILDTTLATTVLNTLNFKYNVINCVSELVYFKNAQIIDGSYNNIKILPSIQKSTKWTKLLLSHNQLTKLPDLTGLKNTLKEIDLSYNQLVSVQQLEYLININAINLSNNKLRSIPNMRSYIHLDRINLSNNFLSFKDFVQFTTFYNSDDFGNYTFGNQFNLTNDTSITFYANYPIELHVPIDEGISGLTYTWHKDNAVYSTTNKNILTIPFANKSDSGTYWVSVTSSNPILKNVTVRSGNINVKILDCQEIIQFNFNIKSSCDQTTASLDILRLRNKTWPFSLYIQNVLTNELINIQKNQSLEVQNGDYHFIVDDNKGCAVRKQNALHIAKSKKCPLTFSPNGDGIQDEIFLNGNEEVLIINKDGYTVKKIQLPAFWNGTDNDGNDAPIGSYALIRKDGSSEKITLLR